MAQHFHSHSVEQAAQTEGSLIRWAPYYDFVTNIMTLGQARRLRHTTVDLALIQPGDGVLDIGCGTGEVTLPAKLRAKAGKVYVFRRHNGTWKQEAELEQQQDSFGTAVAVSKGVVAVASSQFVFVFSRISDNWHLQAKVEPRFDSEESGFEYAGPVSIDGNVLPTSPGLMPGSKGL